MNCGNLNVYNINLLLKLGFEDWMDYVNEYGGLYKHRWGDIETLELFTRTMFDEPVYDFKLRKKGLYEPQLPGWAMAPSVKDTGNRI